MALTGAVRRLHGAVRRVHGRRQHSSFRRAHRAAAHLQTARRPSTGRQVGRQLHRLLLVQREVSCYGAALRETNGGTG